MADRFIQRVLPPPLQDWIPIIYKHAKQSRPYILIIIIIFSVHSKIRRFLPSPVTQKSHEMPDCGWPCRIFPSRKPTLSRAETLQKHKKTSAQRNRGHSSPRIVPIASKNVPRNTTTRKHCKQEKRTELPNHPFTKLSIPSPETYFPSEFSL